MLTDKRKEELNILATWATCAGDNYYFKMTQDLFDKSLKGWEDRDYYKAYVRQREIGFEEFQAEMIQKVAEINIAEELHYMVTDYNFDDGIWFLGQIIANPACDIITAKMLYWLSQPNYYYDNFGSLSNCPSENVNREGVKFLVEMEKRANGDGFPTGLKLNEDIIYEQPDSLDFNTEPYCHVPKVFR